MVLVKLSVLETILGGYAPVKSAIVTATYWAGSGPYKGVEADEVRFAASLTQTYTGEPLVFDMLPTDGLRCVRWSVEDRGSGRYLSRYTDIPDVAEIDFGDLTDVDPSTFEPSAAGQAAWDAAVVAAQAAVTGAQSARDVAVASAADAADAAAAAVPAASDAVAAASTATVAAGEASTAAGDAVSASDAAVAARVAAEAAAAEAVAVPVTNDGIMAVVAADPEAAFSQQLRVTIGEAIGVTPISSFIATGESLVSDGSGVGNNSAIIQRAVNALNMLFLADGQPRQVLFPDGEYLLADRGQVPGGAITRYAVQWKSGVGIATSSRRGVVFVAPPTSSAFVAADYLPWENISHVYCDPHVVDGRLQTSATYTSKFKGWFIQGLTDSYFDDVCVRDTFSTGFGCDYLRRTRVTGEADGCGRGLIELGINPLTTSGASGFGIGTGRFEVEDFDLDVVARNCGFHGVFVEVQGAEPFPLSKGGRVRALVEGNFVGFRDCGSDGIEAVITSRGNTYAEVLHDRTVLNNEMGINGRVTVNLADGDGAGIVIGNATLAGPYTFLGEVRGMDGDGVHAPAGSDVPERLTLDLNIHHCGGDAVNIEANSSNLTLRIREWDNGGYGLAFRGSHTATDLAIISSDVRSGDVLIDQVLAGDLIVSGTRGFSPTGPFGLAIAANGTTLTWEAPIVGEGITDYTVEYRRLGSAGAWTAVSHTAAPATTIEMPFTRGVSYETRVRPISSAGAGAWSPVLRAQAGAPQIVDHFNRTSGALSGQTAPDGTTTPTWALFTTAGGVFSVSSSIVAKPTAGGSVVAQVNSGSANGAVQVKLYQVSNDPATRRQSVVFRASDVSNLWRISVRPAADNLLVALQKIVGGTVTVVSQSTHSPASGDIVRAEFVGNVISWFINDELIGTVTDSALATNTRHGIHGEFSADAQARFDDFEVWAG